MSDRVFALSSELAEHRRKLRKEVKNLCNTDLIKRTLELAKTIDVQKTIGQKQFQKFLEEEMYRRFTPRN